MSTPEGREKMRERNRVYKARTRRKAKITRLTKSKAELKSALLPVQREEVKAIEIKFIEMLRQKGDRISKEKKDEWQMGDLKVLEHVIDAMKGFAKSNDREQKIDERIGIEIKNKNESKSSNGYDTPGPGRSRMEGINYTETILNVMQDAAATMLVSDDDTHGRTTPGEGINDDDDSFEDDSANVLEDEEELSRWMTKRLKDENDTLPSAKKAKYSCEKASTHAPQPEEELGLWISEALTEATTDGDDTSLSSSTTAQDSCEKASTHDELRSQEEFSNWITEGLKDGNEPLPERTESFEKARAHVWKDKEDLSLWDEFRSLIGEGES